jgi:hypothetical protein
MGFFKLSQDVLIEIYSRAELSPKDLLNMLMTGAKITTFQKEAVVLALFMRKDNDARLYQQEIIRSWMGGRTVTDNSVYPYPFDHPNRKKVFYTALARLDALYQVAGLLLINNMDDKDSLSDLLNQLVKDVCSGQDKAIERLSVFSAKMNEKNTSNLSTWIMTNMMHPQNGTMRAQAQRALVALVPDFEEMHDDLLEWIIGNLTQPSQYMMLPSEDRYYPALVALSILIPKLNETHINHLLLDSKISQRCVAADTTVFTALVPYLNGAQIKTLIPFIEQTYYPVGRMEERDIEKLFGAILPYLNGKRIVDFFRTYAWDISEFSRTGDPNFLSAIAPFLNEAQIADLFPGSQNTLSHSDNKIAEIEKNVVIYLGPYLNKAYIKTIFPALQKRLSDTNALDGFVMQRSLCKLMPYLNEEHIDACLEWILKNNSQEFKTKEVFRALLPYVNQTQIEWIMNKLAHWDEGSFECNWVLAAVAPYVNETQRTAIFERLMEEPLHADASEPVPILVLSVLTRTVSEANKTQMSNLFLAYQRNLRQSDTGLVRQTLEVLATIGSKLNEAQISDLVPVFLDNLEELKSEALGVLATIGSQLNETQINGLFPELQNTLQNYYIPDYREAQRILIAIAPKLSEAQISNLLSDLQEQLLSCGVDFVKYPLNTLTILVPYLNEGHINALFEWIQNNLAAQAPTPYPLFGQLLSTLGSPATQDRELSILKQLVTNILNPDRDSSIELNILGEWGMSWMQGIACNPKILGYYQKLINASLTYLPNDKTSFNTNAVILSELQKQWTISLKLASAAQDAKQEIEASSPFKKAP